MDGGSSVRFGHGVAAGPVHLGGGGGGAHQVMPAGAGMIPAGMGSFLLGASGMLAPGGNMVQPGGYLAPAGYSTVPNALHAAWNGVAAAGGGQQQPPASAGSGLLTRLPPLRGPWTEEEDETLKAMVEVYGERKWAAISRHLHGRIGKQCRERWTNHLRPEIDKAKNTWTEKDDMDLIEAHKVHGNRWSMIARTMEGRSENSVKNHWNATKRSLKAKRRLKKKKNAEAPPGQQWSVLEEYIRSLRPDDLAAAPPAPPSDDSPPSSYNVGYDGEVVSPPAAPGGGFDPAALGLYLSAAAGNSSSAVNLAAMNPNMAAPPYLGLDLNAYYYGAPLQQAPPQMMMMGQGQQAAADNLITYPFVDHLAWHSPVPNADAYAASNANAAAGQHYYYYSDAGAAAAASANPEDDVDVVQMASREFQLNPSEEEVTLNLAGFM
ncbi:hypothetical protein GQ55_9G152400 [Panicum hallii var. hallii]|uniref:Uncharacterized protein n=1 Tax=Panicum hallii var. hallii TaxID=1504633 RepID=A0A2T7C3D2_9POAL|nr:hypothetical protein GQ55_9G152400 [Panicum hallii var. hallii]